MENEEFLEEIKEIVRKSPLGDETYNASSTNMRNVMLYLQKRNSVFEQKYKSLTYKNNISNEILEVLEYL